jgi:Protein of unknown function (DUF4089)
MTDEKAIVQYVYAAGALLVLPIDPERAARVAAHLQRTAALAALLDAEPLPVTAEIAEIYSPAAFLRNKNGRQQL